jgi:hypothetical protein
MKGLFLCFALFLFTSSSAFCQYAQNASSFKTSTYLTEDKPEIRKFQVFKKKKVQIIEPTIELASEVSQPELITEEAKNDRIRKVVAKRYRREKLFSNAGLIISTALLSTFLK